MRFELPTANNLIGHIDRDHEARPIQAHRIDLCLADEPADLRRVNFASDPQSNLELSQPSS